MGAAIRLLTINLRGLWVDEITTVWQALMPVSDLISMFVKGRLYHPPMFHILMHYWVQVFGISEVGIRLFPALWGISSIVAAYWVGLSLGNRRVGLIAAGITAVSPFLIWYSQDARMYSMQVFFGFLSVGFFGRALRDNRPSDWVGYGLTTVGGLFSHYTFAFLPIGQTLYFLIFEVLVRGRFRAGELGTFVWSKPGTLVRNVRTVGPWFITVVGVASVFLAWFAYAVLAPAGEKGFNPAAAPEFALRFPDTVRVIVEMLGGFHSIAATSAVVAMWPLAIVAVHLSLDIADQVRPYIAVLTSALIGTSLLMLWGQWSSVLMASRYFIALTPALVLLAAVLIAAAPRRTASVLLALGVVLSLGLWLDQTYSPRNEMRDGNREVIQAIADRYEVGDVIIYQPHYMSPLYDYYLPIGMPAYPIPVPGEGGLPRSAPEEIAEDLEWVTKTAPRVWLALSYQNLPDKREDAELTTAWLESNGLTLTARAQMGGTWLLLFERSKAPVGADSGSAS